MLPVPVVKERAQAWRGEVGGFVSGVIVMGRKLGQPRAVFLMPMVLTTSAPVAKDVGNLVTSAGDAQSQKHMDCGVPPPRWCRV